MKTNKMKIWIGCGIFCVLSLFLSTWYAVTFNDSRLVAPMDFNNYVFCAKDLPMIFDRFYRTDASRNSSQGGSGIGLSIVKKIIEDHGGKIWATSKESTGTVMYFVIRKYQEVLNEQDTDY